MEFGGELVTVPVSDWEVSGMKLDVYVTRRDFLCAAGFRSAGAWSVLTPRLCEVCIQEGWREQ